jgi:hypothetical protein
MITDKLDWTSVDANMSIAFLEISSFEKRGNAYALGLRSGRELLFSLICKNFS